MNNAKPPLQVPDEDLRLLYTPSLNCEQVCHIHLPAQSRGTGLLCKVSNTAGTHVQLELFVLFSKLNTSDSLMHFACSRICGRGLGTSNDIWEESCILQGQEGKGREEK